MLVFVCVEATIAVTTVLTGLALLDGLYLVVDARDLTKTSNRFTLLTGLLSATVFYVFLAVFFSFAHDFN